MGFPSQRHVRGLRFDTVAEAEAAGRNMESCYIFETQTFYEFLNHAPALTVDHKTILSAGAGGNSRWRAVAGKYEIKKYASPKHTIEDNREITIEYDTQYIIYGLKLGDDSVINLEADAEIISL